jgi:hypothetical protein
MLAMPLPVVTGCGGGGSTPPPPTTYTIGGTVSGLAGTGLVLQDNGGDNLSVGADGAFTFSNPVASGAAYSVSVLAQPTGQSCAVANGSGSASANVTNVQVACSNLPPTTYTIGGTVSGLAGTGLVLQDNGGDNLSVGADGAFTFSSPVASGGAYSVSVLTQPKGQSCTVTSGSGAASANVTNVQVACSNLPPTTYTIGGTVSGLTGTGLVLQDNGGDNLSVGTSGAFTFSNPVASGAAYSVSVLTQPTGQSCTVTSGSGAASANVTNVQVACSNLPPTTYTIGGTVSGLTGTGLVLQDNGGNNLSVSTSGVFTFSNSVASGGAYSVSVLTQPTGQSCTVTNGSGSASADVTNVQVACSNVYTVGGTVSGLTGTGLVVQDNAGNNLSVSANGAFTFSNSVASGGAYSVSVLTQPTGQSCTVTNGSGSASADVTNVQVACSNVYMIGGTVSGLTGSGLVLQAGYVCPSGALALCSQSETDSPLLGYYVTTGDSTCVVYDLTTAQSYPTIVINNAPFLNRSTLENECIGGQSLAGMVSAYAGSVHPYSPAVTGQPAILSISILGYDTSNICPSGCGYTEASYEAGLSSFMATAIADGFQIEYMLQWPQNGRMSSVENEARNDINTYMTPVSQGGANTQVTWIINPLSFMNGPSSMLCGPMANQACYQADGLHESAAASAMIAGLVQANHLSSWNPSPGYIGVEGVNANGPVTLLTSVPGGATYSVNVLAQPTGQSCTVTNGSGTVTAMVANVQVTCSNLPPTTYTIGGVVSGLAGAGLVLQDNGGDNLPVNVNGAFTFSSGVGTGAAYAVTVLTQPTDQICAVTNGSGTAYSIVTNVQIVCVGEWAWMGGSDLAGATGVFGTEFQFAASNAPGSRSGAASWTDQSGRFWLFGGNSTYSTMNSGEINDLWVFDPSQGANGEWAWMGGSNSLPMSSAGPPGIYGTQYQFAASNIPGARSGAVRWTDQSGRFWLFGGSGYDSSGNKGSLDDLWVFDPSQGTNGEWAWMGGSAELSGLGSCETSVYGSQYQFGASNTPGGRTGSASWIDANGSLWLFGGEGCGPSGSNEINDLWVFDPSQGAHGQWAWMGGSDTFSASGVYGSEALFAASNVPGARSAAVSWTDRLGLWLFGGVGNDASGNTGSLNDLWLFETYQGAEGEWAWLGGSNTANVSGVYGAEYQFSVSNFPGSRSGAVGWTDQNSRFWLFGGTGYDASGNYGVLNDLWVFNSSLGARGEWAWMGGSNTADVSGAYGTEYQFAPSNAAGARANAASWIDQDGRFWLFGGNVLDPSGDEGDLNDLWVYQP